MPVIETVLTRLLDIEHPILLAPMGSAAGGKLAAAVTHAGGLGLVGSGYASTAAIRKELAEAGNARVGIGFILWALGQNPAALDVALDVALDARPAAIMLSFGDPTPFTGRIKDAGCTRSSARYRPWRRPRRLPPPVPTSSSRRDATPAAIPARRAARSGSSPRSSMPSRRSRWLPPAASPTDAGSPPPWRSARQASRWAPALPRPASRYGSRR